MIQWLFFDRIDVQDSIALRADSLEDPSVVPNDSAQSYITVTKAAGAITIRTASNFTHRFFLIPS
ncbi:MAG: hypothetical protein JXK93_11685 [Sphaerochaetaceae bacterium]|nr:hypothetical protein [Sphaerochaetaceae bacterium]